MDQETLPNLKGPLPNLDDLLQCPVCYELPSGQIFQCNEGHHVCSGCKTRLRNCPVCRSLFFGTRNYAMEELLANIRRLQAFKIAGKMTVPIPPPSSDGSSSQKSDSGFTSRTTDGSSPEVQFPLMLEASRGLWRCFINNCNERLPACRLTNHIRYFHEANLIEGRMENGEYTQVWDVSTRLGRTTNAINIPGLGVFWLFFEILSEIRSWVTIASSNPNSVMYVYSLTAAGGSREYLFKDHVRSSRESQGFLLKSRRVMRVSGADCADMLENSSSIRLRLRIWREYTNLEYAIAVSLFDESEHVVRIATQPQINTESTLLVGHSRATANSTASNVAYSERSQTVAPPAPPEYRDEASATPVDVPENPTNDVVQVEEDSTSPPPPPRPRRRKRYSRRHR